MNTRFDIRRITFSLLLGFIFAHSTTSLAANWYWDTVSGNGAVYDAGGGTWSLTDANWYNAAGNVGWTVGNTAIFGGSDGAYSVVVNTSGGAISVETGSNKGLQFNSSGYTLSGSSAGTVVTGIQNITIASGKTATIGNNLNITGTSSPVIQGGGTLILESGSTFTCTAGVIQLNGAGTTLDFKTGSTLVSGASGGLYLGSAANSNVNFIVDGGTVDSGKLIYLAYASGVNSLEGTITINSGTMTSLSTAKLYFGHKDNALTTGTSTGTLNLNGGVFGIGGILEGLTTERISSTINFNGGTIKALANNTSFITVDTINIRNNGGIINTNGMTLTINSGFLHSAIGGDNAIDGGLQITGGGTLTMTGNNTYNGLTQILSGVLNLSGSQGSGNIHIYNGARLNVTGSGVLGSGTLTVDNGGILTSDATGSFGSQNIVLDSGATITLGNNQSIGDTATLNLKSNTFLNMNFSGAEVVGNFSIDGVLLDAGDYNFLRLDLEYGMSGFVNSTTGDGYFRVLAIPEPSTYAFFILGFMILLCRLPFFKSRWIYNEYSRRKCC